MDNVYVAEFANNTVRKIGPDGGVSLLAGAHTPGAENGRGASAQFRNPWALAVDKSGNVYVSDNGNRSLRKVTFDGVVITLSDSFGDPRGVGVDTDGNIYVADIANNSVQKITPASKPSTLTSALSAPENLAVDGRGFVYATDAEGVHRISPDGKAILLPPLPLTEGGFGPTAHAEAITVDFNGGVYIADSVNNVICRQKAEMKN
jgi:DNA-binding beta-propeller fold protein YncE